MSDVTAKPLADHAAAIRALGKRAVEDVIEIGRRLTEAKKIAGHGNWLPWLEREFGWKESTAVNFMRVYEMSKSANFADLSLPVSGLYLLAAPSTPETARQEVIEQAKSEPVTHQQVKQIINKRKPRPNKARSFAEVDKALRYLETLDASGEGADKGSPQVATGEQLGPERQPIATNREPSQDIAQETTPVPAQPQVESSQDAAPNSTEQTEQMSAAVPASTAPEPAQITAPPIATAPAPLGDLFAMLTDAESRLLQVLELAPREIEVIAEEYASAVEYKETIPQLATIQDKAEGIEAYMSDAGDADAKRKALEIQWQTACKGGALLITMRTAGYLNPSHTPKGVRVGTPLGCLAYEDVGIDRKRAGYWRWANGLSEAEVRDRVAQGKRPRKPTPRWMTLRKNRHRPRRRPRRGPRRTCRRSRP